MALQTMYPAKNNSPATALTEGITAESTSMTLYDASVLPAAPNICVIGNDDTAEIVIYTGISGNTVTGLGRGVNGTIAKAWPADAIVARNITAYDHEAFRANILDLEQRKTNTGHTHDDRYYTETEINALLAQKAPLADPALTGTPTAPTASASTNTDQIATTAYVHTRGMYHVTIQVGGAGTTKSYNCDVITASMRVINCVFGTPANVTSDITWTTAAGNITFTGTFTGATTIDLDLIEVDESTATGV